MILSKLYNTYLALKKQDIKTVCLFKIGIFFIALEDDARKLSSTFNFKLGNLNNDVVKCGFPCNSFYKYYPMFQSYNIEIKIIESENNTLYTVNEYKQKQDVSELLYFISSIDVDNLSVSNAYKLIEELKNKVTKINNMES